VRGTYVRFRGNEFTRGRADYGSRETAIRLGFSADNRKRRRKEEDTLCPHTARLFMRATSCSLSRRQAAGLLFAGMEIIVRRCRPITLNRNGAKITLTSNAPVACSLFGHREVSENGP